MLKATWLSMQALAAMLVSLSTWAVDEPAKSNVTTTTWEIYGAVGLVLLVGFLWVAWQQKREKEREERLRKRSVAGA